MKYQTLPWIAGNPLTLQIPLQKVTITADGHETEDYEPQDGDVVTIILRSQRSEKTYVPEIAGNIATISDNGTLLIGEYAVETLVVESDGTKRRSYYPLILNVMKATPDMLAYFDDFPEYANGVLLDTPSIFFAVGGGTIDAYTKEESDARFVNKVELTAYSTTQQMLAAIASALNGYATEQYVNEQGFYKKPSDGIPSTDLSSAVQTSLGKADSALQSQVQSDWNEADVDDPAYIKNKPSIPAAQVQANWNEMDTDDPSFIKNKPTIPTVPTNVSAFTNDAGYITASDISGKEDKVDIVSASGATLTAEVGKYYTLSSVGTLAITLPTIASGTTKVQTVTFYIAAGSTPAVTFTSTHSIYYSDGFEIASSSTYEVSAAYNGIAWVVASVKIVIPT